jgi:hypothetical protein
MLLPCVLGITHALLDIRREAIEGILLKNELLEGLLCALVLHGNKLRL